jgi:hypothetical protein
MARPIHAAPPENSHAPEDVGLYPLPYPAGAPNEAAPVYFEDLDPPPAEAEMGLMTAMDHVPELDFFGSS